MLSLASRRRRVLKPSAATGMRRLRVDRDTVGMVLNHTAKGVTAEVPNVPGQRTSDLSAQAKGLSVEASS